MTSGRADFGRPDPQEIRKARLYIMRSALNRGADPHVRFGMNNLDTWSEYLDFLLHLSKDHLDMRRSLLDRQNRFLGREDLLARTALLLEYGARPDEILCGALCGNLGGGNYYMSALEIFRSLFSQNKSPCWKNASKRLARPDYTGIFHHYGSSSGSPFMVTQVPARFHDPEFRVRHNHLLHPISQLQKRKHGYAKNEPFHSGSSMKQRKSLVRLSLKASRQLNRFMPGYWMTHIWHFQSNTH